MRDRLEAFGDAVVVAVTFAEVAALGAHRRHLDLPFPLLADPARVTYDHFELGRGSFRQVYSLGTLRLYASLIRRGRRIRRSTQDTRQLGGDFVIAPDGRLAAAFRPDSPDTRPSVDQLLAAVAASRSGTTEGHA